LGGLPTRGTRIGGKARGIHIEQVGQRLAPPRVVGRAKLLADGNSRIDQVSDPAKVGHRPVPQPVERAAAHLPVVTLRSSQQSNADLPEIVLALGAAGRLAGDLQRRQEERHQNSDDGDDHQHFDKRERAARSVAPPQMAVTVQGHRGLP
jgi:hypothetical protein